MTCENITLTGWMCGDWIVQSPEQCDDSNTITSDWCSASCEYETPVCWLTWSSCLLWMVSWDNLNTTCSHARQRQCVNGWLSISCTQNNAICPITPVTTTSIVVWWSTYVALPVPEVVITRHSSSDLPKPTNIVDEDNQIQTNKPVSFQHIDAKLPSIDVQTDVKDKSKSPLILVLPATWVKE
jgi:cysteine-rich repeat protein